MASNQAGGGPCTAGCSEPPRFPLTTRNGPSGTPFTKLATSAARAASAAAAVRTPPERHQSNGSRWPVIDQKRHEAPVAAIQAAATENGAADTHPSLFGAASADRRLTRRPERPPVRRAPGSAIGFQVGCNMFKSLPG